MPHEIIESEVVCPYCWESFTLLIDGSVDDQEYVEDCEICCRPIDFRIAIDESEGVRIDADRQDC